MEPGTETTTRGAAASLGSALATDGEQEPGSGYCWTTRLVPAWGHHCAAQRGPAAKPPGCEIWHVRGAILPRRQPRAPGRALWDAQTAAGMRRAGKHSISVPAACGGTACPGRGERSECPGASPAGLVLLCAAATAQGTPGPAGTRREGTKGAGSADADPAAERPEHSPARAPGPGHAEVQRAVLLCAESS